MLSLKTKLMFLLACVIACATATMAQPTALKNPSPELIGQLTKGLSISPEQAIGGSGALFGLAKTKLNADQFTKVANVVPGMDGLLKAAPKPNDSAGGGLSAMGAMIPGKAGGIASLAGSFKSLGLSPSMAAKFVPIMTKFVNVKGGTEVANLLSGVWK
jgi:Protein of unknown function VcgC/VcgE (DUF2780)